MNTWLRRLWRLRSPMICPLQVGGPGKLVVWFESKPKCLRIKKSVEEVLIQVQRPKEWEHQCPKARRLEKTDILAQAERLNLPFLCLSVLSKLEETHLDWDGPSASLILLIQMLMSPRNSPHRHTQALAIHSPAEGIPRFT